MKKKLIAKILIITIIVIFSTIAFFWFIKGAVRMATRRNCCISAGGRLSGENCIVTDSSGIEYNINSQLQSCYGKDKS